MNVLKCLSIHGLAVVTALNFMPLNAFAQSQSLDDCSCLVPVRAAGQPIGSIIAVDGQVQVSGATGFSNSKAGTMLIGGNRVIVGPRSSASLSLGNNCPLRVSANQDVALDPVNAKICVRVLDRTTTAVVKLPTLTSTSAQVNDAFVLQGLISSNAIAAPLATPAQSSGYVPVPQSPTTAVTTLDTARTVHAAPNDPVPAGGGAGTSQTGTTQNNDNDNNSIVLVVLGLAGVGGIVALALSGGDDPVSN